MIFLRLDWQQNNQFLFIFQFFDDFDKPNLRCTPCTAQKINVVEQPLLQHRVDMIVEWAPSHMEIGLLGELLLIANRINGDTSRFLLHKVINKMINGLLALSHPLKEDDWFTFMDIAVVGQIGKTIIGRHYGKPFIGFQINRPLTYWLNSFITGEFERNKRQGLDYIIIPEE